MLLGKVTGRVWSTVHEPSYDGVKLLTIQGINPDGSPNPEDVVAIDTVDAGVGDTVIVIVEGSSSREVFARITGRENRPVHAMVVAVVDGIDA